MSDLSRHDPNGVGNPNYNVFGLPTTEDSARLIILPVPWEVTVSYAAGTARAPEAIFKASFQVDLFDPLMPDAWKQGFYMRPSDRKMLMKSDYLRKEAELYIDYISKGEDVAANQFMTKTLREVNEGSRFMNQWVYEQSKALLEKGKLVALLGGDHSTPLGYMKALAEREGNFAVLQVDAHCDLRESYEGFHYSHASIFYNVLNEIPQVEKLIQLGVRDFSSCEYDYIRNSNGRVVTYFDRDITWRHYEGETWKELVDEIVRMLPDKVFISFDMDGLDPKLSSHTGTPVPGGFQTEQLYYLFHKMMDAGKKIIGFDLSETGVSDSDWDANVGARVLFKLCNLLVTSLS